MEVSQLRDECIRTARDAYLRGLTSSSGGNISVRIPGSDQILIKRTNASFRDLKTCDLILVDINGGILEEGVKPSKEVHLHLGIYDARKDVEAILHTHPPYTTMFAVSHTPVPLVTLQSKKILRKCGLVRTAPPGSRELADWTVQVFKDPEMKAALLEDHGALTVGRNLEEAYNNADLLESTAMIAFLLERK